MDESSLIRQASQGDARAFEALATPCEGMVWRVCWRLMGSREDAEDAAQNTMIKAWKKLPDFEGTSSFSTWLYRIATTTCLDALRRRKIRESVSMENLREGGFDPPSPEPGPDRVVEALDEKARLSLALGCLPDEQRVPLLMYCMEQKRYDEIAGLLDLPEGTVKSRISRGRIALKKALDSLPSPGNPAGWHASHLMERRTPHDL